MRRTAAEPNILRKSGKLFEGRRKGGVTSDFTPDRLEGWDCWSSRWELGGCIRQTSFVSIGVSLVSRPNSTHAPPYQSAV